MTMWSLALDPGPKWMVLLPRPDEDGWSVAVGGPTRSEARAEAKAQLGISRKGRLPSRTLIVKLYPKHPVSR